MRALLFGFASKLKRNYWFLPLIVLLLLLCALILSSSLAVVFIVKSFESVYDKSHGEMAHMTFLQSDDKTFGELKADGLTDFYAAVVYDVVRNPESLIRVDKKMADELKMPVVGKWFSEDSTDGYYQAIVSNTVKSRYEIGKKYDVETTYYVVKNKKWVTEIYPIEVIGYWSNDAVQIKDVWGNYSSGIDTITIVDTFYDDDVANEIYIKGDVTYYKSKYNRDSEAIHIESVKDYYENYLSHFKESLGQAIFSFTITFSLAVGAMMGNTLLKEDYERRRNAVYFISGQSKKTYLLTKLFELALVLFISAAIFFGALYPLSEILTSLMFNIESNMPISAIIAGFATIYGLYALAEGFYIFKTMRSNFLEEVSRE